MKIAFVGYGKMGHMMEEIAKARGNEVVATIDPFAPDASHKVASGDKAGLVKAIKESGAEGIIEFSHPTAVMGNIEALLPLKLPLVVGTTGWNDKKEYVSQLAKDCGGIIMTSANFSVGVNLFYRIVEEAAKYVSQFPEYDDAIWEMHHNQKADSPSGTALEIARRVMNGDKRKTVMVTNEFKERPQPNELHVSSTRCGSVPGTHSVFFDSKADTIELTHTARSREGFANGAVRSVERLKEYADNGTLKHGNLYSMDDLNLF